MKKEMGGEKKKKRKGGEGVKPSLKIVIKEDKLLTTNMMIYNIISFFRILKVRKKNF